MRYLSKSVYQLLVALALAFNTQVLAQQAYTYIAGYEPQSDVTEHSQIDLDVQDIIDGLPAKNGKLVNDCAGNYCNYDGTTMSGEAGDFYDRWTNGKHSTKTVGIRNIRDFAKNAATKCSGNEAATDVD